MSWEVEYLSSVVSSDIPSLTKTVRFQIKKAIEEKLMFDPVSFGKPLRYSFKGHRKLRVGDYRIIYRLEPTKNIVIIVLIGHRKNVYAE